MRVGFLGGLPPSLGGGGREIQMRRTASALEGHGIEVVWLAASTVDERVDVVHAFGVDPAVWHYLELAHRHPATPIVVTPTIVWEEGMATVALRIGARIGVGLTTTARMVREVLDGASVLTCLTDHEASLCRSLGSTVPTVVISNGSDARAEAPPPADISFDALIVGSIGHRKRQTETVQALAGLRVACLGAADEGEVEKRWRAVVADQRVEWPGALRDRSEVLGYYRRTGALVLWSKAEAQSLAVLDALALGVPVVLSDIGPHRDLQRAHPGLVRLVNKRAGLAGAVVAARGVPRQEAVIPTWEAVAERLAAVYAAELARR